MNISGYLSVETITLDLKATDKNSAITELVGMLKKANKVKNCEETIEVLLQREKLGSTGIGQGIAIPHGRMSSLKEQVIALGISKTGLEFDSLDALPVNICFLLVCPEDSGGQHLQAIALLSRLMKNKKNRQDMCAATTAQEIIDIIKREEQRVMGAVA
ncbi:MAG: PTS sugar transporter subunit IIA [Endomicrobiales bacterium]